MDKTNAVAYVFSVAVSVKMADNVGVVGSLEREIDCLSIASEDSFNKSNVECDTQIDDVFMKWGLTLNDLYRLALRFYKEKEGKAVHLSYEDKLKLVAYSQCVKVGKYDAEQHPAVGVLDVIGRDRRLAWQALGNMDRSTAMSNFVELLDHLCPLFKPYLEAHKRDIEEKARLAREEEEKQKAEEEMRKQEEEARRKEEEELERQEAQKRQIQEALNQQTYHQFKAYAEQQFPGNPEQQAVLIRQLQEQHYHQYMQQLCQRNELNSSTKTNLNCNMTEKSGTELDRLLPNGDSPCGTDDEEEDNVSQGGLPSVTPASMWTRKDIKDFKESIRKEGGDAVIKVGHGETVTVRVPTHEDGTCLFWEFATDSYDLGFGVYFEWTKSPTNQVSVHISESEEDEEIEDDDEEEITGDDVEKGGHKTNSNRPPTSVIIPVYRRDCHEEVYAGSHVYPGQGVYLLKFDNSYSLWRSKTLYYRVYYTR